MASQWLLVEFACRVIQFTGLDWSKSSERVAEHDAASEADHTFETLGPCWHLEIMAVKPIYHGRGIGSRLLHDSLLAAQSLNRLPVALTANHNSKRLYQRQGFTQIAEREYKFGMSEALMVWREHISD